MSLAAWGMGLRAFVALSLEEGGGVGRLIGERVTETDQNLLVAEFAYGLSAASTLFAALPVRFSSGKDDRLGDLGLLYRHTFWRVDAPNSTTRLGLLAGAVLPTKADVDPSLQGGAVLTIYRDRNEYDFDFLWQEGLQDVQNAARYDLSWQYRLTPAHYIDWEIPSEWYSVIELGGRWQEGHTMVHQMTLGLQYILPRWVLEGGVTQDLNGPHDTRFLISARIHF